MEVPGVSRECSFPCLGSVHLQKRKHLEQGWVRAGRIEASCSPCHPIPGRGSVLSLWHVIRHAVGFGVSDVHSDICISAFLMTAFCLPNPETEVAGAIPDNFK